MIEIAAASYVKSLRLGTRWLMTNKVVTTKLATTKVETKLVTIMVMTTKVVLRPSDNQIVEW